VGNVMQASRGINGILCFGYKKGLLKGKGAVRISYVGWPVSQYMTACRATRMLIAVRLRSPEGGGGTSDRGVARWQGGGSISKLELPKKLK
jgi:hypothetical protein